MASSTLRTAKRFRSVPCLSHGERLSRAEFEKRYQRMPEIKAELIEGVVHMSSPLRQAEHGEPHLDLATWMGTYRAYTPGVRGGVSSSIRLDMDNEHQPDGVLFLEPAHGGRAFIDSQGYIAGSPELAAEVSASTMRLDMRGKFKVYRRNEVQEYLIWRVEKKVLDWYALRDGSYDPLVVKDGLLKSDIFPGLWLDPDALIMGDLRRCCNVA